LSFVGIDLITFIEKKLLKETNYSLDEATFEASGSIGIKSLNNNSISKDFIDS